MPITYLFSGLYINLHGHAECFFTKRITRQMSLLDNHRTRTETIQFTGEDIYLSQRNYLFGAPGADAVEVPSGIHLYDFECQLPPQLPASFEASHGHIRYKIEAVLDVPWGFDKECKIQFTVIRNDDLNLFPELLVPMVDEHFKRFCCLFCKSEPLIMTVNLPHSGYIPGQNLPIHVRYKNQSNISVRKTNIKFKRITRFNSHFPYCESHLEKDKLIHVDAPGCGSAEDAEFEAAVTLPSTLLMSNSIFCNIIQVFYELEIEAETSGCHENIEMCFLITIGSVPVFMSSSHEQFTESYPVIDSCTPQPVMNSDQQFNQPVDFNHQTQHAMPPARMFDSCKLFIRQLKLTNK